MRGIVLALLVINIAVAAYFQFFAPAVLAEAPQKYVAPVGNYKRLAILSEQELLALSDAAESDLLPQEPALPPVCTLVGPFPRLLDAENLFERLEALDVLSEIKNVTVSGDAGYWLHLSPQISRKEALSLLRELQQKNVDSYIIPSGNLENGISLGVFSNQDRANSMQESIRQLGYDPKIAEVNRDQQEVWLFLPQGEAAKLTENRWVELLSVQDSLQKRQNLCSDVASLSNFQ